MPLNPQPGEIVSTPRDIEYVKKYKDQETFTANDVNYVKLQIMFKRENVCKQ